LEIKSLETKYGLYHIEKQKILGYEVTSNEDQDFCNEKSYSLTHYSDTQWLVDNPKAAEWIRVFNVHWYNSSYEYPMCDYYSYELKVVEVKIQTSIKDIEVSIPTLYEFYENKYAKSNPKHWEQLKADIDKISPYYIYELDSID
jgi:hypothetical protein